MKTVPIFKKLYYITKVGLYYGCRRSEMLGLKWSAIDFDSKEIVINHTVVRAEQGDVYRDNVKTESSYRYYPLLDSIRDDLMEIMESQKKLGIYSKDGYVFQWEDGRVYSPDYITKLFKKAVIRSGCVPQNLTVHGLRHSCCAILFENGWDLGQVQNWLGHSDIAVTANIYNHVSRKWKNKHGEMVDRIFA
ncbi:MAG: site-specific integrase [Blautia sp.]|nr:site-specific integrase [Blautia sp.]